MTIASTIALIYPFRGRGPCGRLNAIKLLIFLLLVTSASAQVTDSFSGSGAVNGSVWTQTTATGGTYSACVKSSGVLIPTGGSGNQCLMTYTGTAFAPNQYSQVVFNSGTGSGTTGPAVLMSTGGFGYFWFTSTLNTIYRLGGTGGGGGAGGTGASCPIPSAGDTIRLSALVNGASVTLTCKDITTGVSATVIDNIYVTGDPGILVDQRTSLDTVSNFQANSIPTLTPLPNVAVVGTTGNSIAMTGTSTAFTGSPFTLSGGTGASITAQSCSDSTHCTITLTPGSVNANLTITDTGSGAQTIIQAHIPQSWYVRADGGTRYSANATSGQCDGLADVSYASTGGSGTNQHCAFNDYRFLWDDQSYNNDEWAISGTDTVIVRNGPWRVGYNNQIHGSPGDPWCLGGGTTGCANPLVPMGTTANPTKLYGENYASCQSGGMVDKTKTTQLYAGWQGPQAINLSGAVNVEVKCIEVTQHSNCRYYGTPNPNPCQHDGVNEDWAADGVTTSPTTSNVKMEDFWSHGHQGRGIKGPFFLVTCNRCLISNEAFTGWDFDDGCGCHDTFGTPFLPGSMWVFTNSIIEGSGCKEEYPIAHAIPWQVGGCFGQSAGGQGDGVGGPQESGVSATIDHAIFRYNVQDALDLGHTDTGSNTLSITNSQAYGNMAGTYKWGGYYDTVNFQNNVANANCLRMSAPITGAPTGFNDNLTDYCRAGDAHPFDFKQGSQVLIANNSYVTYMPTTFDVDCWQAGGAGVCNTAVVTFKNNIVLGYDNPGTYTLGGQAGGPGLWNFNNAIRGYTFVRTNNIYYNTRNAGCPTGFTAEVCTDPQFIGEPASFTTEAALDNFNFNRAVGGDGTTFAGQSTTDAAGNAWDSPRSIGAFARFTASAVVRVFVRIAHGNLLHR